MRKWVIICVLFAVIVWAASVPFSLTYSVALTPYGPIADDGCGYARVRALGLAYGSLVVQTKNRCREVGWKADREEIRIRLLPFIEGNWPVRTYGLPIPVLAALFCAGLALRRRFRSRRASVLAGEFAGDDEQGV